MGAVNFQPIQTGSGNPSPDNIRPILPVLNLPDIGAVYGGSLDTLTGVLTVDMVKVALTGSEGITWTAYGTQTLYSTGSIIPGNVTGQSIKGICSAVVSTNGTISATYLDKPNTTSNGLEFKKCLDYWGLLENTSSALNAKLAEMNAAGTSFELVYQLATPVTHALTDAQYKLAISQLEEYTGQSLNSTTVLDLRKHMVMNALHPETVSGDGIVSFTANASKPMEIGVQLEPVQDLHGYDSPWPAGGGKNKYSGENPVVIDNALFANVVINPIPAGDYVLSGIIGSQPSSGSSCRIAFRTASGGAITAINLPYTANTRTSAVFTLTEECGRIYFYYGAITSGTGSNTIKDIQIEPGSTVTAYAPYSNICPISGWDAVNVTRTGRNLLFQTVTGATISADGRIANSNTYYCKLGRVKAGVTYYTNSALRAFHTELPEKAGEVAYDNARYNTSGYFIAPIDGYVVLRFNNEITEPMMSLDGSDYEPYSGQTYPITFPVSAGTVYGGTLTVNEDGTWRLVVDRAEVDLGTLSWTYYLYGEHPGGYSSDMRGVIKTYYAYETPNVLCTILKPLRDGVFSDQNYNNGACIAVNLSGNVKVTSPGVTDSATLKTALSGVQLVYELATPLTYSLTATQIKALVGQTNIWTDAGDGLNVKYWKH